jgi:hypothetical protein
MQIGALIHQIDTKYWFKILASFTVKCIIVFSEIMISRWPCPNTDKVAKSMYEYRCCKAYSCPCVQHEDICGSGNNSTHFYGRRHLRVIGQVRVPVALLLGKDPTPDAYWPSGSVGHSRSGGCGKEINFLRHMRNRTTISRSPSP